MLVPAQKITGLTLRMQQGRRLQVKIQDPGRVLGSKQPQGGSRSLQVQLLGPKGAMPRVISSSRPERDGPLYETIVPAGNAIRLRVDGVGIAVADALARPLLNDRVDQQFQPSAAANVPTRIVFRISAKN